MSNLNENQFRLFHGTNRKTIKGGVINPTKQRGDEWEGDGPHAAFASTRLEDAASYGQHVYEVHPQSYMEHHGYGVVSSDSGFDVKRKMKPEVVDRYSRIYGPIREEQERIAHGKAMYEMGSISHGVYGKGKEVHISYDKDGNKHEIPVESYMNCSECKKPR
jgi:hypothetical protein